MVYITEYGRFGHVNHKVPAFRRRHIFAADMKRRIIHEIVVGRIPHLHRTRITPEKIAFKTRKFLFGKLLFRHSEKIGVFAGGIHRIVFAYGNAGSVVFDDRHHRFTVECIDRKQVVDRIHVRYAADCRDPPDIFSRVFSYRNPEDDTLLAA